ncbi:MAG: nuclear transport factor 2 family protein, partial [Pseudonocardiaceae bacterium]
MNADISEIAVLQHWHSAINSGDVAEALKWCSPGIVVHGPLGAARGHEAMRQWLTRTGIRLEPQGEFGERDGRFVVQELAR